ncbi:MAG: DUF5086 family protein [Gallionella sp.]|nr:DUF5086 family protein [Gallionella sp.]MDD4958028.1 DUF5086 family protein [Gallionella sp.]
MKKCGQRWLMGAVACLMLVGSIVSWGAELRVQTHPQGIWSIASTQQEKRWLIIHNLTAAQQSGVYHIEVIGRTKGDPVWKIKHLANHLAMSESALSRSIIAPLTKGAVYPESFENAYSKWQALNNGAGGEICQTDVLQCLGQ